MCHSQGGLSVGDHRFLCVRQYRCLRDHVTRIGLDVWLTLVDGGSQRSHCQSSDHYDLQQNLRPDISNSVSPTGMDRHLKPIFSLRWQSCRLLRCVVWCKFTDVWDVLAAVSCLLDDGGSKDLWNVGNLLLDYMTQPHRRQPSSDLPSWEPEISLKFLVSWSKFVRISRWTAKRLHSHCSVLVCHQRWH
jgi:hypothetical protein